MASAKTLSPERAVELVKLLTKHDDARAVAAIIELMYGLYDPHGDPDRSATALKAIEYAFTRTPTFRKALDDYLEGNLPPDVEETDTAH